ncbi:MAG TPA: hypothetical protein VH589_14920 [Trebonia sp.]
MAGCGGTVASSVSSAIKSAASNIPTQTGTAATATTESAPATPTQTAANTPAPTTAPAVAPAAPAATSTPASSGSGSNLVWLWVLLGAAVIAGLMVWITRMSRRKSAPSGPDWQSGLIDAYAKGSALHDAMSAAEAPGAMAAGDAGLRWADIQRRADDLAQTLYGLREAAPDPASQARVADTLASLQAARSAMDTERTPGGVGPQQAEVVRGRLYAFESSLQMLRAGTQRYP